MKTLILIMVAFLGAAPLAAQHEILIVRQEKAQLEAAGFDFHVITDPNDQDGSEEARCGAAAITWRAAHRLAQMGNPVFLIGKNPGQNGCTHTNGQRYSHDAIVFQATCIDVLQDSETANTPAWNICTSPIVEPGLWRPTFALDVAPPPTPAPPISTPVPVGDLDALVDLLAEHDTQMRAGIDSLRAQVADLKVAQQETAAVVEAHDAKVDQVVTKARGVFRRWVVERIGPVVGAAIVGWFTKGE